MRKKYTLSFLIIISLSFLGMMISVLGQTTYTCEMNAEDQVILELLKVDEYYSRTMSKGELGAKKKFQVSNVSSEEDYYLVQVNFWDPISANETFNITADFTTTFNVTKDPAIGRVLYSIPPVTKCGYIIRGSSPVVLHPVNSYLSEYVLGSTWNATSNGNTLVMYVRPYTYYFVYDSNGFFSELKITNNTALMERWGIKGQSSTIPGYDLSILIGLTTIAVFSLVYILKKKS